jgi:hypothetical protein
MVVATYSLLDRALPHELCAPVSFRHNDTYCGTISPPCDFAGGAKSTALKSLDRENTYTLLLKLPEDRKIGAIVCDDRMDLARRTYLHRADHAHLA